MPDVAEGTVISWDGRRGIVDVRGTKLPFDRSHWDAEDPPLIDQRVLVEDANLRMGAILGKVRPSTPDDVVATRVERSGWANPYNFVPFPARSSKGRHALGEGGGKTGEAIPIPMHDRFIGGLLSGVIDVEVELLTPLHSPAPARRPERSGESGSDGANAFDEISFLRDPEGRGVLPGSSVRGAVRSVAEVLAAGCASRVDLPTNASWRPVGSARKGETAAGILEGTRVRIVSPVLLPKDRPPDGWRQSAQRWRHGETVWFKAINRSASRGGHAAEVRVATEISATAKPEMERGILFLTGDPAGGRKKYQRIFPLEEDGHEYDVSDDVLASGGAAHSAPRSGEGTRGDTWAGASISIADEHALDPHPGSPVPVHVRIDSGTVTSIGVPALYRELYPSQPGHLLDDQFQPCSSTRSLCWSCALFGAPPISGGADDPSRDGGAQASRVRFGEFRTAEPLAASDTNRIRRAAMGAPHPGTEIFYLTQRAGYGRVATASDAILRGRKFYWHQPAASDAATPYVRRRGHEIDPGTFDKFTPKIEVLIPNRQRLNGEVRFWNLTEADLGLLLISLDPRLLDPGGRDLCHKLGGGKPLGLGSARLTVKARLFDRRARYGSFGSTGLSDLGDPSPCVDAFRREALAVRDDGMTSGARLDAHTDVAALILMLDYEAVRSFSEADAIHYPPGSRSKVDADFVRSYRWFQKYGSRNVRDPDPLRSSGELAEGRGQRDYPAGR